MNIKETFLKLTTYLIPFRSESLLRPYLPKNTVEDSVGNYYINIGNSKTMFTCHIDSYTKNLIKVNHVLYDGDTKVKTDGKTPLGGDDKTGMCIMLYMIENNVPGTYYFFIGEEPILSGGVYGSKMILRSEPEFFKKFDRVIAFDRKGYNSIISKQNPGTCCSKEFVESLINEFAINGLEFEDDPTGYYTDSAVFMFTVPEITNLSVGGFNEHKNTEWVDLDFLEKMAKVCTKINWEKLPVVRDPLKYAPRPKMKVPSRISGSKNSILNYRNFIKKKGYDLYKIIKDYMDYYHMQPLPGQKFIEGKNVIFSNVNLENENSNRIRIRINGSQIWMNDKKVGSLDNFERRFDIGFDCRFFNHVENFLTDLKNYSNKYNTNQIPFKDAQILLRSYGDFDINQLLFNYDSKSSLFDENDFFVDHINKCLEI